jgi:hypothetical protein
MRLLFPCYIRGQKLHQMDAKLICMRLCGAMALRNQSKSRRWNFRDSILGLIIRRAKQIDLAIRDFWKKFYGAKKLSETGELNAIRI